MRLEPIPQGLWLRLLHNQYPELHRKRAWPKKGAASQSPTRQRPPPAVRPRRSEALPIELWEHIFRAVPPGDLLGLRAACGAWRTRLDNPEGDDLWEAAYRAEWRLLGATVAAWHEDAAACWRTRFLARWWAHGRWGTRPPTVCTLMGKKAHGGTVTCVVLGECGADGEGAALSASDDASIFLWRFTRAGGGHSLAGSPHAVAQQHHRQCQGGDVRCPQRSKQFYGHAGPVWCLCFDPARELLLSGGYDGTVKLWNLSGERCQATLRGHDGWVRSLALLEDGQRVISGGSDGILKLWSLDTLACLHSAGPPNGDVRHSTHCLAALEDHGALLSAHSAMPHLLRWDLQTMQNRGSFYGHEDDIYAIHADGPSSLVVSGSKDRTVRVWDARLPQGNCVAVLRAHTGAVLDLKLRGNRIVSASMDKTVKMWDIREPQAPVATLEGHSAEVHCVDFRDRMVLSGSRDTSLKVWTVV